jgi:hypothetical protein
MSNSLSLSHGIMSSITQHSNEGFTAGKRIVDTNALEEEHGYCLHLQERRDTLAVINIITQL